MRWRLVTLCVLTLLVALFAAAVSHGAGGQLWFGWWDSNVLTSGPYTVTIVEPRPGGATERAGLRAGDRLDLRDQSLASRIAIVAQPSSTEPTDVTALRGDTSSTHRLIGSTNWEGPAQWKIPVQLLSAVAFIWFAACALLLALRKATNRDAQLLIFVLLCLTALELDPRYIVVPSTAAQLVLFVVSRVCLTIAPLLLLRLSSRTGRPSRIRTTLTRIAVAFVAAAFLADMLAAIGITTLWYDPLPFIFRVTPWRAMLDVVVYALVTVAALASVRATPAEERPRAAWLLLPLPIAICASYITQVIAVTITLWLLNLAVIGVSSCILVLSAALVTYALLKRRVLDFEFVLSRTIVVATVSLIVVACFILLEFVLNTVLTGVSHATGLVANAALALVLGLSLTPIHKRVDAIVDNVLFHKRHSDERALADFGHEAAFVTNEDALLDRAIEKLEHHTDARNAMILLDGAGRYATSRSYGDGEQPAIDENDAAVLALKAHHAPIDPHQYTSELRGALALPMLARGRLCGIIVLGERTGGEAYAPDEISALAHMAHGVGSAIDVLSTTESATSLADAVREELAPMRTQLDAIAKALHADQR